jgi:hypothetical protein
MPPALRQIANLWTFMEHPSKQTEWALERKLDAICEAGFAGVCWAPSELLQKGAEARGLIFVGGMASGDPLAFPALLEELRHAGAHHVNVQLGSDELLTPEALKLSITLLKQAHVLGLEPAIETHRGTCTETPEKLYSLAEAYKQETGKLLPVSWDFSHYAVVKHLIPENFTSRLIRDPQLIQNSQQFHFRPFNGHHAQLPITDGHGNLTSEVRDWLPFAAAILRCWLQGNLSRDREIFICPELGPIVGGYSLSSFPDSWSDAILLKKEIDRLWTEAIASA